MLLGRELHKLPQIGSLQCSVIGMMFLLIVIPALVLGGSVVWPHYQQKINGNSVANLLVLIIGVQVLIVLPTLTWWLGRKLFEPLRALSGAAQNIINGELKAVIPALGSDELGDMANKMETMRSSLVLHVNHLEKRVEQRTSELSILNKNLLDTLKQLQQAQSTLVQSEKLAALGSLVAGIAHELNTPIGNGLTVATSLRQSTEQLKQQMLIGMTRRDFEDYLNDVEEGSSLVEKNIEKASELVQSFKQAAVDRASAQRRYFEIGTLISETVTTLSPSLKKTPFNVVVEEGVDISMDSYPGPLGQVLTNLINNAVRHAFEGRSHGKITVKYEVDSCGYLVVSVRDNGIGTRPEHMKRIFDPFFTTKLGEGGNGLGMHIVHNIVTVVLGGDIFIESNPGDGSCIVLELPVCAPREELNKVVGQC